MTTVYFVRHAEPNYNNHDDRLRELSEKGMEDRKRVSAYLADKGIDAVLSSPYKRAVDTVSYFAESRKLPIRVVEDFRERKVDSGWIEDFDSFCKRQWADFSYRLTDGETLAQVQSRNVSALGEVLREYAGKNIVIGSHGTALSTVIHFYDPSFGYEDFLAIKSLMPWIVKFSFEGDRLLGMEEIDLFCNEVVPYFMW